MLLAALARKQRFYLERKVYEREIARWRIKVGQIGAFIQLKKQTKPRYALDTMFASEVLEREKDASFLDVFTSSPEFGYDSLSLSVSESLQLFSPNRDTK